MLVPARPVGMTVAELLLRGRPDSRQGNLKVQRLAGQVALDEHGAIVGAGDLSAQTTQVMKNIGLALAAANATFSDVVKITTYVVGYRPEHRAIIGKARSPFFADMPPPASTLVGVSALAAPEWLIEIEAIAVTG